jgi:NAD(P)-dependent dehydrogenase (short-subunit alcohol dehydrogenase family)
MMGKYDLDTLFGIKDKVVAITGAGGVLCGEMAKALAQVGAKVAIMDLRLAAAEKVAKEITDAGGQALALECNVLDKASLEKAKDAIVAQWSTIDILINGAGGNRKDATTSPDLSFFDIPAEAIKFVFDLNIIGALLPSQVFGKVMAENKKGCIINISSMNAFRPLTKIPGYSAAKAGISNFTQWLSVHLCQNYSTELRVNAIAPGFFLTDQNRFLLTEEKTGDLTARGQCIIDHTPKGCFGKPADLISTLLWLVGPGSSFVNGVVIPVDGGFSAFSGV